MISLERRLHVGLALGLVLLLGIFGLVGSQVVRGLSEDSVIERLRLDAWTLEGALVFGSEPPPPRRHSLDAAYNRPLSGNYYQIRNDDGRVVKSPSLADHELDAPRLGPGESERMTIEGPAGETLLLLLQGYHRDGQGFTIAVAEDLAPLQAEQMELLQYFALIAGGGLLLVLLLQRLLVRRSLRVLEQVREDVRRLERGRAPQLSEEVPRELLPLVQDFNQSISVVNQRVERSRSALGNLAQALRRPLALLIQYLDEEEKDEDAWQRIHPADQVGSISRLTDRGFRRAVLAGQDVRPEAFDPRGDLGDLTAYQQQRYQEYPLEIDFLVEKEMPPFGEREEILELLGTLVDNACERASSRVNCRLSGIGEVEIRMEDDGSDPGDPEHEEDPRAGQSLAVVRDIVALRGGSLELGSSVELGGLEVRILLPMEAGEAERREDDVRNLQ